MRDAGAWLRSTARAVALASVVVLGGFSAFVALAPAGARGSVWMAGSVRTLAALAAFAASLCQMRRSDGQRRAAWTWIATGLASWAVGQCIWDWYALARVEPVPAVSAGDFFFFLGVPLAAVGVVLLGSGDDPARNGARLAMDGVVIAGSLLFISWATALGVVDRSSHGPIPTRLVDVAYPAADIVMTAAALVAWSVVGRRHRLELALAGGALVAFSVADSAGRYLTDTGTYANASVFAIGAVAGFLLIAVAALLPAPEPCEAATAPQSSPIQAALPYVPFGLAVGIAVDRAATGAHFDELLVVTGFLTIAAVLARQLIMLLENMTLAQRLEVTVAELRMRETELAHRASHDPLTGLANRVLFADRIDHAIDRLDRSRSSLALLVCDLDEFKSVNDTLGHHVGDEVLRIVAERISATTRRADTVARLGGDEFAILLEDLAGADAAYATAERITEAVRRPIPVGTHEVHTSTSIGLAVSAGPGESGAALLQAADVALYEAKSRAKGGFTVFEPGMLNERLATISLKSDLAVLSQHPEQLEVHYQPIVDLRTNRPNGVEALVRWRHPRLGLLYPDWFIATAEQSRAIIPVGAAVLDRACAQLAAWRAAGVDCTSVSVNVSGVQLRGTDLVTTIRQTLRRYDLHAEQLTVEVTESVMLHERDLAVDRLRELRAIGVRIAIDDFGTGYSSLDYLRSLPADVLKIDRTFTNRMDDETTVVLMDLMMQLARALGLRTVAEGVETPDQLSALRALACDDGQGFLIARPGPAEATARLLSDDSRLEPRSGLVPNLSL